MWTALLIILGVWIVLTVVATIWQRRQSERITRALESMVEQEKPTMAWKDLP
jgi:hypothetical protein